MRVFAIYTLLVLLLAGLGAWAFVSHQPDHPLVVAAEGWPVVGSLVLLLRESYRPTVTIPVGGPEVPEPGTEVQDDGTVVRRPGPPWEGLPEWVWVAKDTPIHTAPDTSSEALQTVDAISNLARLERRGDWFRVWRRGKEGWVHLPGYPEDDDAPPFGMDPEPPRPLDGAPPEPARLEDALALFGTPRPAPRRLGPFALWTDVDDETLLRVLDRVAAQVEPLWVARHGVEPVGGPASALLLFRRKEPFHILRARTEGLRGLHAEGFAGHGMVALYAGNRAPEDVASTLVHELAHRLHRRTLGPALPPWLDEGLAEDLALSRIAPDGTIDVARLSGSRRVESAARSAETQVSIHFDGGLASLWNVRQGALFRTLPSLSDVTVLDWQGFVRAERPGRSRLYYDLSALWVRYLATGEEGALAPGWNDFLRGIAKGGALDADTLYSALGRPPEELEEGFRDWVLARGVEALRDESLLATDLPATDD